LGYGADIAALLRAVSISVMRKPHIVVIGHLAGPALYGAERSLLDIVAAVDRRKYRLSCVLPARNDDNDEYVHALARHTDDIVAFYYEWWKGAPQGDPAAVSQFEELFRRNEADLVHVNTVTLFDPLIAARNVGVPSILHARELIFNNPKLCRTLGGSSASILRQLRAASDFVIANSDVTHRLFYKDGRSFRQYGCIDLNAFDIANDVEPGRLKVGIISSNDPHKGIELFVRMAVMAARRNLGMEFSVIGPHTEHTYELTQFLRHVDVPVNIRFTGYIDNAVEAVHQVNVVVSLSIVPESFGRTLAEAMAARRPVIAFDYGAPPELIRHGKDGFIVPYLHVEQVLAHLEALAREPDEVAAMGSGARARAEQLFSPTEFASSLNAIYQSVLDSRGQPAGQGRSIEAPALAEA